VGIAVGAGAAVAIAIVVGLFMWRKWKRRKGKVVVMERVSEVLDPGPGPYEMACPNERQSGGALCEMESP
jgi:hypothetical protein